MKQPLPRREDFDNIPEEQRAMFAESLRERIYSTITLLAVVVGLWQHPTEHRPIGVIGVILGTVFALWLATVLASRMSAQIIHKGDKVEASHRETVRAASGLLAPAGAPVFFVILSMLGIISLQTALLIGIFSLILSLFLFSVYAGRKTTNKLSKVLIYSLLQMALGIGIVALKLIVK